MKITKENFEEYKDIQELGEYNMLSSQARELTNLTKKEWVYIMKNYELLDDKFKLGKI
tara:strand:+ start:52 stop:225 length:174 start_codon:yes stop_codon:yes gene_type:complete